MLQKTESPVAGDDRAPKRFRWAAETNSDLSQTPADRQARTAWRRDFNAEARVQASIVEHARLVAPDILVFAVPNGGLRSKAEAARMKWTGTLAGIPDLVVIAPVGRVFFIEVKTPAGRLSDDQRAIFDRLVALGTPRAIVRSIDDVRRVFAEWRISTREARSNG